MAQQLKTANSRRSIKHDIIQNANTKMLIAVSVAVFIVIFSLIASKALISQAFYQNKIISEKKTALNVLKQNKEAVANLGLSYSAFAGEQVNVIGGNKDGTGPKDGDNAKLVLDSLPSVLDFPALSSSIEKILLDGGYAIESIGGDEAAAGSTSSSGSATATTTTTASAPTEIAYPIGVTTTPEASLSLLKTFENSIRPFQITSLSIQGSGNNLNLRFQTKTFYQPATEMQVSSMEVK